MKVLVCGSRTWADWDAIDDWLCGMTEHPDLHIITGTKARQSKVAAENGILFCGADEIVHALCEELHIPCTVIEADWKTHGRAAGPIRNRQMLDLQPELVVAFRLPGRSNGTDDTVREARRRGIPVEMHGRTEGVVA